VAFAQQSQQRRDEARGSNRLFDRRSRARRLAGAAGMLATVAAATALRGINKVALCACSALDFDQDSISCVRAQSLAWGTALRRLRPERPARSSGR